jgi:hypothetical protein
MSDKLTVEQINELHQQITTAVAICHARPTYAISGSLGLMLQGVIPVRPAHDIDLMVMCDQATVDAIKHKAMVEHGFSGGGDIFNHSVTTKVATEIPVKTTVGRTYIKVWHDLFHMSEDYDMRIVHGEIRVHRADCIWRAKERIGGDKHTMDRKKAGIYGFPQHLLPTGINNNND